MHILLLGFNILTTPFYEKGVHITSCKISSLKFGSTQCNTDLRAVLLTHLSTHSNSSVDRGMQITAFIGEFWWMYQRDLFISPMFQTFKQS